MGTTGKYKEMQALKVELTGPVAEEYDVWYRAQCEHYGWLGWAKNGEAAGTEGRGYRMEAVQIVLRPKGSAAPGGTSGAFMVDTIPHVDYRAHTAKYGWLDQVSDGAMAGTKGEYLRMEALEFSLRGGASGSGIRADALVEGDGWQGWATGTVGTTGKYKEMQALKVELTGPVAEEYDVWYRAQCEHYGWLGWAKNGEAAGTEGYGYRMEAVQIVLRPKGSAAPGGTSGAWSIRSPTWTTARTPRSTGGSTRCPTGRWRAPREKGCVLKPLKSLRASVESKSFLGHTSLVLAGKIG